MAKNKISTAERDALIDYCVHTQAQWWDEVGSLAVECHHMLRYGRVGYRAYTDEELIITAAEMRESEDTSEQEI